MKPSPMFLIGWAVALALVSGVAFLAGDAASSGTAVEAVRSRMPLRDSRQEVGRYADCSASGWS